MQHTHFSNKQYYIEYTLKRKPTFTNIYRAVHYLRTSPLAGPIRSFDYKSPDWSAECGVPERTCQV